MSPTTKTKPRKPEHTMRVRLRNGAYKSIECTLTKAKWEEARAERAGLSTSFVTK